MRRMCRGLEFDICEMAFTTYVCARAAGLPFTAIPLFVTRNFHHWAIFYNEKSGIRTPKDLEGRKVGVNRGYTVTTGLWARGILQSEYGVDLNKITWVPTDDEHVLGFQYPPNVDNSYRGKPMKELLLSGVVDAALGEVGVEAPEIKPLIPDARNAAFDYFRKTGIYPINHGVVVKNSVLKENPWDRRRTDARVRGGQGGIPQEPEGQRDRVVGQGRDRQRRGGRRPVPVRHREEPQGAGGDHAIRVRPEDGAAEVYGRRAVRAGELSPLRRAWNDAEVRRQIDRRLTIWKNVANRASGNAAADKNKSTFRDGERRWPS